MANYRRINPEQVGNVTVVTFVHQKIMEWADIQKIRDELFTLIDFEGQTQLVIDFTGVGFFASAALNVLINLDGKVKSKSGQLRLCNIAPEVYETFVITRLANFFTIVDTRKEALKAFAKK